MTQNLSVPRKKLGDVLLALLALAFVSLGIWMLSASTSTLTNPVNAPSHPLLRYIYTHPLLYRTLSALLTLGSAQMLFRLIQGYFNKTPGLSLTAKGIIDAHYDPRESLGPVPWRDIVDFYISYAGKQKTLVIELENPDKYLRLGNRNRQRNSQQYMQEFGSPIAIPKSYLKTDIEKLVYDCKNLLAVYKKQQ